MSHDTTDTKLAHTHTPTTIYRHEQTRRQTDQIVHQIDQIRSD